VNSGGSLVISTDFVRYLNLIDINKWSGDCKFRRGYAPCAAFSNSGSQATKSRDHVIIESPKISGTSHFLYINKHKHKHNSHNDYCFEVKNMRPTLERRRSASPLRTPESKDVQYRQRDEDKSAASSSKKFTAQDWEAAYSTGDWKTVVSGFSNKLIPVYGQCKLCGRQSDHVTAHHLHPTEV